MHKFDSFIADSLGIIEKAIYFKLSEIVSATFGETAFDWKVNIEESAGSFNYSDLIFNAELSKTTKIEVLYHAADGIITVVKTERLLAEGDGLVESTKIFEDTIANPDVFDNLTKTLNTQVSRPQISSNDSESAP